MIERGRSTRFIHWFGRRGNAALPGLGGAATPPYLVWAARQRRLTWFGRRGNAALPGLGGAAAPPYLVGQSCRSAHKKPGALRSAPGLAK